MITIPNLEIHVTHKCNLNCDNCSHYSNYGFKGSLTLEDFKENLEPWCKKLNPKIFSLLGGEPTLNKQLTDIVYTSRSYFKNSYIQLISNGWFLEKHPLLPIALEKTGTALELSIHHDNIKYQKKVNEILSLIEQWQTKYNFKFKTRKSYYNWRQIYQNSENSMKPFEDNDKRQSWKICPSKFCPQIVNKKIYKCPQVAYFQMIKEKFNLGKEWNLFDEYKPLEPNSTDDEIKTFFKKEDEDVCSLCPANKHKLYLQNPIRRNFVDIKTLL